MDTLTASLRLLANNIDCEDGVAIAVVLQAADEIERLRLTDAERHCLREVRDTYADEDDVACNEIAAVLDGLLERTS